MFQNIVRYHFHNDLNNYKDEYFDNIEEALKRKSELSDLPEVAGAFYCNEKEYLDERHPTVKTKWHLPSLDMTEFFQFKS